MRSPDEMKELYADFPEALENTTKISDMCNFDLETFLKDTYVKNPSVAVIPSEFENGEQYMHHLVQAGLASRYKKITGKIKERSEREIKIISQAGFINNFLVAHEVVSWAGANGIDVCMHDSDWATSIVAYVLGITKIDPIKYDLVFETVINPETEENAMLQVSLKANEDGRKKILSHIKEFYGADRTNNTAYILAYNASVVFSDLLRRLQIPKDEADFLEDSVNNNMCITSLRNSTIDYAFECPLKGYEDWTGELVPFKDDVRYKRLFDLTRKLENKAIYAFTHVVKFLNDSAITIMPVSIADTVPIFRDYNGEVATQYDQEYLTGAITVHLEKSDREYRGKSFEEKIVREINKNRSANNLLDKNEIDYNDKVVFEKICSGKMDKYLFLFDNENQTVRKIMPDSIERLAMCISISGRKFPPAFTEDCIKDIVSQTDGMFVFYAQIIEAVMRIAGFSVGKAAVYARTYGKYRKMKNAKKQFIDGALKNGFDENHAAKLYALIESAIKNRPWNWDKAYAVTSAIEKYEDVWFACHYPKEYKKAELWSAGCTNCDDE